MSTGINFAPSSNPHHKRGSSGDIEYSSGEGDEPKPQPAAPATPSQSVPQQGKPDSVQPAEEKKLEQPKPKKAHTFFSWRKKQHGESAPTNAEQVKSSESRISLAPHHQIENVRTDLLHGSTVVAQKPTAKVAQPAPHVSAPVRPIAPPAPKAPATTPAPAPVAPPAPKPTEIAPQQAHILTRREQKKLLVDELPVTEVNLIPDVVLTELEKRNKLRDLGYVALSLVAVVLFIYGGLKMYERKITSDTVAVETDILTLNEQIAAFQDTQLHAQDLSDRLTALDRVMQAHVYWTPFLQTIEDLTLPTVYYTAMTGSETSLNFTFDVVAQSYSQVAPQVELFRQSPLVADVTISATQSFEPSSVITATPTAPQSAGGVTFKMTVQFTPETFIHPQLRSYAQN